MAVTVPAAVTLAEIEPVPVTTDQVPEDALPPIVPDTGKEAGSQTWKSAPAFTVAIGLTVAMMFVEGPAQPFAVGVMV